MKFFAFLCPLLIVSIADAASPANVKAAISKGSSAIVASLPKLQHANHTIAALAAYKGGVKSSHPEIQKAVEEVLKRCTGGKYEPGQEHIYQAGVEATLLSDVGGEKYQDELKAIRDYIVGRQQPNGGWNYPSRDASKSGDTSVIQYGCLGLWAVERAGVKVDEKVWENVLKWHVQYQNADGGFSYFPGETTGALRGQSELTMTVNAIGSMHIAMIHINPNFLPLKQDRPAKKRDPNASEDAGPKFGVLEQASLDDAPEQQEYKGNIPASAISAVKRAYGYITPRFRNVNDETPHHKGYYYYSLERMAALADIQQIGNKNWFDHCADFLIQKQAADGSWSIGSAAWDDLDTTFAVLFLTRSTGKLLKRVETPSYGDGLLAGGRGLPDDLSDVDFNGRSVKQKEKPTEPLDILLASLSKTGGLENLDEVQKQIVEQVQIGNREELIGQVDQLLKLVDHPDPGIRQTVVWALGRTGNMNLAQHLIDKLSDEDLIVMTEARNALCWISRKPLGFGFPEDPLIDLSDRATDEQKAAAIAQWHKNVVLTWGEWYLKNRPFEDRGDAFEAKLRMKMDKLKYGF